LDAIPPGASSKPNYAVENSELIVAGTNVQARLILLAPGQIIPWHYHSEITDHYFVLRGALKIETMNPKFTRTLVVGERHQLTPGTAHSLSNRISVDCQFLLLQGVGRYDWIKVESEA